VKNVSARSLIIIEREDDLKRRHLVTGEKFGIYSGVGSA
jgi:hypothetical protein